MSGAPTSAAPLAGDSTILISRATGVDGPVGNSNSGGSGSPGEISVSANGRYVAFQSVATNLGANDTSGHVYVRDTMTDTTTLVSRADGASGAPDDGSAGSPAISGDGRYVAFRADSVLTPGNPRGLSDIFLRDTLIGTTTLISKAIDDPLTNASSLAPAISGDGRFIAFYSVASNLSPDDEDSLADVFLRDTVLNTTSLVSRASGASGPKPKFPLVR